MYCFFIHSLQAFCFHLDANLDLIFRSTKQYMTDHDLFLIVHVSTFSKLLVCRQLENRQ